MNTAAGCVALAACLLVSAARAADSSLEELELSQIKSLDEMQGVWTLAPEGRMWAGHTLEIKGHRGQYSEFSDTGMFGHVPISFDVEIVRGVLVLKTIDSFVEAKKWHLAKLGNYRCIVALIADTRHNPAPYSANAPVLYFRSGREQPTQNAPSFIERRPPIKRRSSISY